MGVLRKDFISSLHRGLYRRLPKNYHLYLDGEYLWHKGTAKSNTVVSNAENQVAEVAYRYVCNIVYQLALYFGNVYPEKIWVYMDGERIRNKEIRPYHQLEYDVRSARRLFVEKASTIKNSHIVRLESGESELEMYLKRVKTSDLNVFVTADTDMVSICYGHEPIVYESNDVELISPTREYILSHMVDNLNHNSSITLGLSSELEKRTKNAIADDNFNYQNSERYKITDSCAWFQLSSALNKRLIGFDYSASLHRFYVRPYRTFVSLCGTDFTRPFLTPTMSINFFSASNNEIDTLNTETDTLRLMYGILYLCCKRQGTRLPQSTADTQCNINDVKLAIDSYLAYIQTGKMTESILSHRYSQPYLARKILQSMTGLLTITAPKVTEWCVHNSINVAIKNVESNLMQKINTFGVMPVEEKKCIITPNLILPVPQKKKKIDDTIPKIKSFIKPVASSIFKKSAF